MNNDQEFSSLRAEIIESINLQNNYIIAMYTIAVTIMGFAIDKNNPILFLMPYIILFPFQTIINSKRDGMLRMGAYIEVFYEDSCKWESANYLITDAMSHRGTGELKLGKKIRRFMSQTGAVQIGSFCSIGASILQLKKIIESGIAVKEIPINDIIVLLAALILFIFIWRTNMIVWRTRKTHEDYVAIIKGIKENEEFSSNKRNSVPNEIYSQSVEENSAEESNIEIQNNSVVV